MDAHMQRYRWRTLDSLAAFITRRDDIANAASLSALHCAHSSTCRSDNVSRGAQEIRLPLCSQCYAQLFAPVDHICGWVPGTWMLGWRPMYENMHVVSFLATTIRLKRCLQPLVLRALALREFKCRVDTICVAPPEPANYLMICAAMFMGMKGSPIRRRPGQGAAARGRQRR